MVHIQSIPVLQRLMHRISVVTKLRKRRTDKDFWFFLLHATCLALRMASAQVQCQDAKRTVRNTWLLDGFMLCIQKFLLDSNPQGFQFTLALA